MTRKNKEHKTSLQYSCRGDYYVSSDYVDDSETESGSRDCKNKQIKKNREGVDSSFPIGERDLFSGVGWPRLQLLVSRLQVQAEEMQAHLGSGVLDHKEC